MFQQGLSEAWVQPRFEVACLRLCAARPVKSRFRSGIADQEDDRIGVYAGERRGVRRECDHSFKTVMCCNPPPESSSENSFAGIGWHNESQPTIWREQLHRA